MNDKRQAANNANWQQVIELTQQLADVQRLLSTADDLITEMGFSTRKVRTADLEKVASITRISEMVVAKAVEMLDGLRLPN